MGEEDVPVWMVGVLEHAIWCVSEYIMGVLIRCIRCVNIDRVR